MKQREDLSQLNEWTSSPQSSDRGQALGRDGRANLEPPTPQSYGMWSRCFSVAAAT